MGRKTRIKEERAQTALATVDAILAKRPVAIPTIDFSDLAATVAGHDPSAIVRPATTWKPPRTKDRGRITLSIAKHLYGRFPTPHHLETVWSNPSKSSTKNDRIKTWYIAAATGKSVHKLFAKEYLSRRETHVFLNPPVAMGFDEAMWYAVARSYTDNHGVALRISKSRVARGRVDVPVFWREVARFFCTHAGVTLREIDDLCDYLSYRLNENDALSMKGRTLESVKAQSEQWHRDMARIKKIGGGTWDGMDLPDFHYATKDRHGEIQWAIVQIKTGNALAEEGNAQHHCVSSYKYKCVNGSCSIWSLRMRNWETGEKWKRAVTLEVNSDGYIVQARGYANRSPTQEEKAVIRQWTMETDIENSNRW